MAGFAHKLQIEPGEQPAAQERVSAAPIMRYFERRMFNDGAFIFSDGARIPYWGFEDTLNASGKKSFPSPLIRMREGETAQVRLEMQKARTQCKSANAKPGTDLCVSAYDTHIYQWQPRSAGTWLYQNHVGTPHDFEMGLYGLLVVDPEPDATGRPLAFKRGPAYDVEQFWVLDDIDPAWHTPAGIAADADGRTFAPSYFLINGVANTDALHHRDVAIHAKVGDKLLIRLLNASYSLLKISVEQFHGDIISVDGTAIDRTACPWTSWIPVHPERPVIMATGSRHDLLIDLDPSKNPVVPGKPYRAVFEFLDLSRRCVRNDGAASALNAGRIVTTITVD